MNKTRTVLRSSDTTKNILIILISLLTVSASVFGVLQYNKVASLKQQVHSLDTIIKTTTDKNSALGSENANMKKAVLALKAQITSDNEDAQTAESPALQPGSEVTITNVGHQAITVPANDYHGPLSTNYTAISLTLTNKSTTNQTYDTNSFSAITDSGAIIKPSNFGPGIEQTVWTRSDLAPNGHADIVLLFPSDQKLTTLTTTTANAVDQLVTIIPTAR